MRGPAKRILMGATVTVVALFATAYSGEAHRWKRGHGKSYRVVNVRGLDLLHVRAAPAYDAPMVGALPFDARDVYGLGQCMPGWCLVSYAGQITGWVSRHYIVADIEGHGTTYSVVGVSTYGLLKIRERPSAEAGIVGAIPPFEITVTALGPCVRKWCPVAYRDMQGWVRRGHLSVWSEVGPRYLRRTGGHW